MMLAWTLLVAVATLSGTNGAATRIIGGEDTSITRYPSVVQVDYRHNFMWWSQTCAGNVLTTQYVLSVAHCFTGFLFQIAQRRIRAGTTVRNKGGFTIGIVRALNHPTYGSNDYEGDITILQLEERLNFGIGIQPVILPNQGFVMFDDAPVTIVGWGTTRIGGGGSSAENLQHADVKTIKHDECLQRYSQWNKAPAVTENMICVGFLDVSEVDACEGDQGGPVFFNGDILIGIISWARSCANAFFPRVNTKVSSYADWINANIQS